MSLMEQGSLQEHTHTVEPSSTCQVLESCLQVDVDMLKLIISLFEEASQVDQAVANIFARVCWRCYATYTYAFAFKRNKVAKDTTLWQRLVAVMKHYISEVLWLEVRG